MHYCVVGDSRYSWAACSCQGHTKAHSRGTSHLLQQRAEVPFQHAGLPAVACIPAVHGFTGQRGHQVRRQLAVVLCPADGMYIL